MAPWWARIWDRLEAESVGLCERSSDSSCGIVGRASWSIAKVVSVAADADENSSSSGAMQR